MATYIRQGGQIALMLTEAEAKALRDLALYAEHALAGEPAAPQTKSAADRASQALASACNNSARCAASF